MNNEKIFRVSRYLIFGVFALIFALGLIYTGPNGRSRFMEHPLTMTVLGVLAAVFGAHLLVFRQLWVKDTVEGTERMVRNKPEIIQLWLGFNRSPSNAYAGTLLAGVFFIAWGIMFMLLAFRGF